MFSFCGVIFPDYFKNPKWVTKDGYITLQIDNDNLTEEQIKNWEKQGRKELADLMVACFHRFSGQTLEPASPKARTP